MALCLTVGAGENKFPTAHSMLISREALSDKQVKDIQPYFDLYGDVIRIEKSKASELRNALDGVVERNVLDELWRRSPEKEYYKY